MVIHVKDKLMGRHLILTCLLSLLLLQPYCGMCVAAPSRDNEATAPYGKWERVVYSHGQIVRVGDYRLPLPIILPHGLRAAGDVAILRRPSDSTVNGVELFFKSRDEVRFRKWVEHLPEYLPFKAGTYTIKHPQPFIVHIKGDLESHSWRFASTIIAKSEKITLVWFVYNMLPSIYDNMSYHGSDYRKLSRLFHSPPSPVGKEKRIIYLEIGFHPAKKAQ